MNDSDILSLLGGLSSTPNWNYGLGLAQLGPQYQANTIQQQLGSTQLANQLQEFQAQQALAAAQQQWQQQFQTTGQQQQYGLQSGAQQFGEAQQTQQQALQNALFPWTMAQAAGLTGNGTAGGAGRGTSGTSAITGGQNPVDNAYPTSLAIRPGQYYNSALGAINPAYANNPMFSGNLYGA
jgi:hypothetical protein